MSNEISTRLPPIQRSIKVQWGQQAAFQRFTADFGKWWPSSTHSIGGDRVGRIVFECRVGGRIFEELKDGRRYQWGTLRLWEPPRRVAFSWHPSKDASVAQDVEVTFTAAPDGGTRVVLVSAGWEKLGSAAKRARRAYALGWGGILAVFAGRRTFAVVVFGLLSHTVTLFLKSTGRLEQEIDRAGGRMPPA
jgi:uncharacterized protein YndB with AHSA1/START domain